MVLCQAGMVGNIGGKYKEENKIASYLDYSTLVNRRCAGDNTRSSTQITVSYRQKGMIRTAIRTGIYMEGWCLVTQDGS